MANWLGQDIPKLGFGMMRMPTKDGGAIDLEQVNAMVDAFMQAGFTYFDTAYGYHDGQSESTVKKAVVDRYPRDKYILATKLPVWLIKAQEDMQRLLDTQLDRTGAGYFDFYMLHAVNADRVKTLDEFDTWAFLRGVKEKGIAKHIGLSFHDTAAVLDDILTKHPELEFVQLQINYADWEDKDVQSRLCYETALRHGKSVIIMEPVKGGALAAMSPKAREVFTTARPDASVASWAMRFAASLDGVITVLSGMSDLSQMQDNIATMAHYEPLTDADRQTIDAVRAVLEATPTTPCTNCKYCIESGNCPQNIPIPAIIDSDNSRLIYDRVDKGHYGFVTSGRGKASDCIQCGACESRCPQHIQIISLMEACAKTFE